MINRDRLVTQILKCSCKDDVSHALLCVGCLADFIIADRKRILKPLIDLKIIIKDSKKETLEIGFAISKTLENAELFT